MERALPWVAFWAFMGCVALAFGMANINPQPGVNEINAMARKETAAALAARGASPAVIQCVLNPPTFSFRCYSIK